MLLTQVDASRGMVTVGCTPLVTNYNILLGTDDKRVAAQVTRSVREKDGGLRWVSATFSRVCLDRSKLDCVGD